MNRWMWAAVAAAVGFVVPGVAAAQVADPQVVLVPYAPNNPQLPHPAHSEARITLKGMLRNANCAQGYEVRWDVNRNGRYDDDAARVVTPSGGVVRDIGRTYTVPAVGNDQSTNIDVRVLNRCTNGEAFGTFRLFTYTWSPSPDPRQWTADQIDTLDQMAIQEALWYIHRNQTGHANAGATIKSYMGAGGNAQAGAPLAIWAMALNGHLAAYPPGTIDRQGVVLPDGWEAANDRRWNTTPYAEDAIRMLNYVLEQGTGWQNIEAEDEDNSCGYNGQDVRRCNRVVAPNNQGMYTNGVSNNTYYQGVTLGGLAPLMDALAGTPLQTGGVARGMRYEVFIQELTDWLGGMQIDSGCGRGGWYYSRIDGNGSCSQMDASTAQWGYIGLESAEAKGRPYGVFVNNHHKYSLADNLVANQGNRGGSNYRSSGSYANNLQLTGGAFVAARWMGVHTFRRGEGAVAFP
ncbi:MAG: hypothetical protein KC613_11580, partial [Myxococcales bacterium]|nr:hypothetical protein [Myxococcales bacterium]